MKYPLIGLCLLALVFIALTACTPSNAAAPTQAAATQTQLPEPTTTATLPPTATALPPTPALLLPTATQTSFEPAVYQDEANGFKLDYPTGWTVIPNQVTGSRGSQALLLSPGSTAETLADSGTRISITVYAWDPKNDLAAYATQRRTAWDSGGSKIIAEGKGDLADRRKEMHFTVEAADKAQAYFLITTIGDKYLQIAGEGNLSLADEIAHTMRP